LGLSDPADVHARQLHCGIALHCIAAAQARHAKKRQNMPFFALVVTA
jgi:hypothetical protein